jgi:hypothetical protein
MSNSPTLLPNPSINLTYNYNSQPPINHSNRREPDEGSRGSS